MSEQSRENNPAAAAPVDGHTHGADPAETEMVTKLMAVLEVSCAGHGSHTHAVRDADGHGRVRTIAMRHHHHDLRCLVEAGVNSVLPRMRAAETRADMFADQIRTRGKVILEQSQQIARLEVREAEMQAHLGSVHAFFEATPSVGPWKTVGEAYDDWVEERDAEASAG